METSSVSGGGGGDEQASRNLHTKYQKLAAEYAKLRSQVGVLKKAVIEEQQKSESLKSSLAVQDQTVRKLEQELDSVNFRNRQLEKRIEILQQSSHEGTGNKGSAGSTSSGSSNTTQYVDSNSLLLHVEQNKQLQESLAMLNEKYNSEVGRLRRVIDNEMVPKELFDSMKTEFGERVTSLNRKVAELGRENLELVERVSGLEQIERDSVRLPVEHNNRITPALHHHHEHDHSDPSTTLHELVIKLTESEQAKEKLSVECQILRMKLKRRETAAEENSSGGGGLVVRSGEASLVTSPVSEHSVTNMIGRMMIMSGGDSGDDQTTCCCYCWEDSGALVQHLRERLNELVRLVQVSDTKAIHYYREALSLCRLVKASQLSYKRVDNEFGKLKVKFKALSDEMEDIKRGYNTQVDSLTEHIACLNDKLAAQAEDIIALKSSRRN